MKYYCPSCGFPNEYSLAAPSYCGQCRGSLQITSTASAPQTPAKPKQVLRAYREDDDEDEESGDSPVDITIPKKLDVEITLDPPQRQTLGSVMQGSESSVTIGERPKVTKKALKEKLVAFRENLQKTHRKDLGGR